MALKDVDRGPDRVPSLLLRTDRVDDIAQHREGLERDHDLVVLGEVADQKQDLLGCHWALLPLALPTRDQVRPSVGFLERPHTRLSATQDPRFWSFQALSRPPDRAAETPPPRCEQLRAGPGPNLCPDHPQALRATCASSLPWAHTASRHSA